MEFCVIIVIKLTCMLYSSVITYYRYISHESRQYILLRRRQGVNNILSCIMYRYLHAIFVYKILKCIKKNVITIFRPQGHVKHAEAFTERKPS